MKLIHNPISPYARKCRVVILEKGLADRVEFFVSQPPHESAELLGANPVGRIPALVLDDGTSLCESPVICEYLDSLVSQGSFFPKDDTRFAVLNLAALASGITDAAVSVVGEMRRPEEKRFAPWIERKEAAVQRGIAEMAAQKLATEPLNIGLIAAVCALDYVSFRLPHIDWRKSSPQLAEWLDVISKRPSFAETKPV